MTNLKNIMTRAWEIAREAAKNFGGKSIEYISEALKMAWAEVKKVVYTVEELIEMGAKRWVKGNYDRLYLNQAGEKLAGLEIERYNSGNIFYSAMNGEEISHSAASRILGALNKAYIDLKTKKLVYSNNFDREEIEEAIENIKKSLKLA